MNFEKFLIKLKLVLAILLPFLYVVLGIYVMIEKIFVVKIPPKYAYSLGPVFLIYGIYRIFRAYKSFQSDRSK